MAAPGARAREDLSPPARAALDAAGSATGALFGMLSRLRGSKCVHPKGVVHAATVTIAGNGAAPAGAALLRAPAEHPAIVRFSRSFGLPDSWPDLLGMSLRLRDVHGPGRHQDLLMVSSVDAPVAHHVFLPASDPEQRPYSTSLPYRAGGVRFLLGAVPRGGLRFDLCVARIMGRFARVGEIRVGERLAPELDATTFNPWNTGGGIEPAGVLNRLRDYAYPLSQRGWDR
jgi:hypothetical protein